jgi:type IV secretory pathway VirB3-like protein
MIKELLDRHNQKFITAFILHTLPGLVMWIAFIFYDNTLIPAIVFTLYGGYRIIMLLEDYFFLRTVRKHFKNGSLESFINDYYESKSKELSNKLSSKEKKNFQHPQELYYKEMSEPQYKFELNLALQLRKMYMLEDEEEREDEFLS